MAITIFEETGFKGYKMPVDKDLPQIVDRFPGNMSDIHPSFDDFEIMFRKEFEPKSMKMTDNQDACVLFKKERFRGNCIFRRGNNRIQNLGRKGDGGKTGFKGTVSSIRITPVRVPIRIVFIANMRCELPRHDVPTGRMVDPNLPGVKGKVPEMKSVPLTEDEAFKHAEELIKRGNKIFEKALIEFDWKPALIVRAVQKYYNMKGDLFDLLTSNLGKANMFNVFIVNDIHKAWGIAPHALHSTWLGLERMDNVLEGLSGRSLPTFKSFQSAALKLGELSSWAQGRSLAHEFGHICGLGHKKSKNTPNNLMVSGGGGDALDDDQIAKMHDNLANHGLVGELRRL